MAHILFRFWQGRRGNVGMLTAITLPMAVALGAIAVDSGSLYLERRSAQTITDLSAIAAAAASSEEDAKRAALRTFTDNGFDGVRLAEGGDANAAPGQGITVLSGDHELRLIRGRYSANPVLAVQDRFVAGATPPNAVQVEFATRGELFFGASIMDRPTIRTRAIAHTETAASFSIGSRLLRLDGGVLNRILGALTGSRLSLTLMDYEALAAADVDLLAFLTALNTRAELRAATYDNVLAASVTTAQITRALQDAQAVDGVAKTALGKIASAGPQGSVRLRELIALGPLGIMVPGTLDAGVKAKVGTLATLSNVAALANGGNQVSIDLDNSIPGLVDLDLALVIGERPQHSPWVRVGSEGEIVRTAQTRMRLAIEIAGLGGLLPPVIKVPLYLDIAQAEATLADIRCTPGRPETIEVDIAARPGIAHLRLAEVSAATLRDFSAPPPSQRAKLITVPLLVSVTGFAATEIASQNPKTLTFAKADIDRGAVKRVATTAIVGSLATSLLKSADVKVEVLGLGLGLPSGLKGLVQTSLTTAAPAIDIALNSVLSALGISLGEADIRVHAAQCGRAVLVQ